MHRSLGLAATLPKCRRSTARIRARSSETGDWSFREYCKLEESVELPTLGFSVPLIAIYRHALMRQIDPPKIDPEPTEQQERQLSLSILFTTFFNYAAVALTYIAALFAENQR